MEWLLYFNSLYCILYHFCEIINFIRCQRIKICRVFPNLTRHGSIWWILSGILKLKTFHLSQISAWYMIFLLLYFLIHCPVWHNHWLSAVVLHSLPRTPHTFVSHLFCSFYLSLTPTLSLYSSLSVLFFAHVFMRSHAVAVTFLPSFPPPFFSSSSPPLLFFFFFLFLLCYCGCSEWILHFYRAPEFRVGWVFFRQLQAMSALEGGIHS